MSSLKLVSSQEWVVLPEDGNSHTILHRDYKNGLHGLVFVDEEGGNSVLMDSENNIIDISLSSNLCYECLQKSCDHMHDNSIIAI